MTQMVNLGYETHNAILNLGSISVFTTIVIIELVLLATITALGYVQVDFKSTQNPLRKC